MAASIVQRFANVSFGHAQRVSGELGAGFGLARRPTEGEDPRVRVLRAPPPTFGSVVGAVFLFFGFHAGKAFFKR
jgi:hypothetical protein